MWQDIAKIIAEFSKQNRRNANIESIELQTFSSWTEQLTQLHCVPACQLDFILFLVLRPNIRHS